MNILHVPIVAFKSFDINVSLYVKKKNNTKIRISIVQLKYDIRVQ